MGGGGDGSWAGLSQRWVGVKVISGKVIQAVNYSNLAGVDY
jgi:hypothetical protein